MQFLNPDPLNPDQESIDAKVRASLFVFCIWSFLRSYNVFWYLILLVWFQRLYAVTRVTQEF